MLLSFPSITSTGDLTIEFMCLNVDSAGHKKEEAASAISDDVSALLDILRRFVGDDVKLSIISLDMPVEEHRCRIFIQNCTSITRISRQIICNINCVIMRYDPSRSC
jgi:hypothetical protein